MNEPGIERIAVIGAGMMGFGVAVEFARFGYPVSMYNRREESSRAAMQNAGEDLDLMAPLLDIAPPSLRQRRV